MCARSFFLQGLWYRLLIDIKYLELKARQVGSDRAQKGSDV